MNEYRDLLAMGYSEQALDAFCTASDENRAIVLDTLNLLQNPDFNRRFHEMCAELGRDEIRGLVAEYKAVTV